MNRTSTLPILLTILALALPAAGSSLDERIATFEPIPIHDPFLLTSGYLTPPMRSALTLAPGSWEVDASLSISNSFAKSTWLSHMISEGEWNGGPLEELEPDKPLFVVDGELQRMNVSLRRGLTRSLELGIEIPWISVDGGRSDSLIENFHEAFRLGNDGRELFPRHRGFVYVRQDGEVHEQRLEATEGLGDVGIHLTWRAPSPSRSMRLAVTGSVELPTGDGLELVGANSLDYGVTLVASGARGDTVLHGSFGLSRTGANELLETEPTTRLMASLMAAEPLTRSSSAFLAVGVIQTPLREGPFPELARNAFYLGVGVQIELQAGEAIQFAVVENFGAFENSADVALQVGLTRRWP